MGDTSPPEQHRWPTGNAERPTKSFHWLKHEWACGSRALQGVSDAPMTQAGGRKRMRNPFAPHALAVSLMLSRDERHLCLSSLSLSSGPLCTAHVLRVREGRYRRLRAEVGGGAGVGRCAVFAQKRERRRLRSLPLSPSRAPSKPLSPLQLVHKRGGYQWLCAGSAGSQGHHYLHLGRRPKLRCEWPAAGRRPLSLRRSLCAPLRMRKGRAAE